MTVMSTRYHPSSFNISQSVVAFSLIGRYSDRVHPLNNTIARFDISPFLKDNSPMIRFPIMLIYFSKGKPIQSYLIE